MPRDNGRHSCTRLFVKENELKDRFGTSRAPIREAIRLLAADRMVVVSAYKRKYVRKITREDLLEVIPVLASLEGCAAKLTAEKVTPKSLESLAKINTELAEAYQANDIESCIKLNFKFHRYYIKNAGNEALKQAVRPIIQRIVRLWVTMLYKSKPILFENYDLGTRQHNRSLCKWRRRKGRGKPPVSMLKACFPGLCSTLFSTSKAI